MPDPSVGEAGGIFAGVVALFAVIGKGVAWILRWDDRKARTRHEKLDAWHRELVERERAIDEKQDAYQARIEQELSVMRAQNAALVGAYQLIVAALRTNDPASPALGQADELLRTAFPIDPITPPHLVGLVKKIP